MTQEAHDNDMEGATAFYCPDSHNERKRRAQRRDENINCAPEVKDSPAFLQKTS